MYDNAPEWDYVQYWKKKSTYFELNACNLELKRMVSVIMMQVFEVTKNISRLNYIGGILWSKCRPELSN